MTVLHSVDFFPAGGFSIAVEPRAPQGAFPEHHHDFHEIVLVEQGSGIHVLNGQPQTLCGGCVCFIRDHDRHLYEQTDNLHLTNVLYRGPDAFRFLSGLRDLLPQEKDGNYAALWRINNKVMAQAKALIDQLPRSATQFSLEQQAEQELRFMQLLVLLRQGRNTQEDNGQESRLRHLLDWLNEHYSEEIDWDELANQFSLSLRTLHRQLKQQTGSTPQRYLNRLRLLQSRHLLRHSDMRVTDIAFHCGFGDSNHFSTLFKREFGYAPRNVRQHMN
ncbi:HTH-type transcriptional activator RhaS [Rouxiella badensis]|jgi:AraC family L-rhamnose operon regulatory protein RhaS|uniref:Arabinose operon regulatory protein n=1 Tax=Rouxiella badensis TaxID=1646377 RepID=A0A1X0WF25_9GAMM|nr:HTH-type transcriptional activator RhaS [Rouxiella badensis]MCC3720401.1 HTH-type transcriptional activator RhaS [Rouxiella badensis]MCC3730239.1 HTH-type transcriptional activator RhaS [Rouxiella badensis]MCC3734053.1 HTH-type transcriptional activator RhaS [Rouxiella badensis]MCC3741683.1 HTH-type transcriptional activator RhaS [Rouxiella badensis]MCC3748261.1 HTH-type transcriptional activator RhaS [Rouxiella badensis]